MSNRIFSQTSTTAHRNSSIAERWELEKLFGTKFSRLTIEDEYKYNLSYLLSDNTNGKAWQQKMKTISKLSKLNNRDSSNISQYNLNVCRTNSADELLQNRSSNYKPKDQYFHLNVKPGVISKFPKCQTPIPMMQTSPSHKIKSNSTNVNKNNDPHKFDRVLVPRTALITAHQPSQSPYPGLHIYVTESPPRPYYDFISTVECSPNLITKKSVACDPILINSSENVHQRKSSGIGTQLKEFSFCAKNNGTQEPRHPIQLTRSQAFDSNVRTYATLTEIKHQTMNSEPVFKRQSNVTDFDDDLASLSVRVLPDVNHTGYQPPPLHQSSAPVHQCVDHCFTCCKRTYPVDRISIGNRVYHKACFRCATCHRTVLPGTFSSLDGVILCKPHYIEQFRKTGRYEVRKSFIKSDDDDCDPTVIVEG